MGKWETERGHGSDAMADILGAAFKKIAELPENATLPDLADAIEFASRGMLVVELHEKAPDENAWKPLCGISPGKHIRLASILGTPCVFKTIPNRGQIKGLHAK